MGGSEETNQLPFSEKQSILYFASIKQNNCTTIKGEQGMKEFRLSKGVTEHYTSLEELGKAYNCKPNIKRTKDEEKLKKQQEKFMQN